MIARYYHHMDKLIMIRRSTSSTLKMNKKSDLLSLKSVMPTHKVKTVELFLRLEEKAEAQWIHRVHARFVGFDSYRYGS